MNMEMKNKNTNNITIERGQIYFASLPENEHVQGGERPVLVIQNNIGNKFSPNLIVCTITSKINKKNMPTHVRISKEDGMRMDSDIQAESILTISKKSIIGNSLCKLSDLKMNEVRKAIMTSLAF